MGTFEGKRGVLIPVLALGAGCGLTFALVLLLNASKGRLPAMAAVDEVHLIVPDTRAGFMPSSMTVGDWKDRPGIMRGNVIGIDGKDVRFSPPLALAGTDVDEQASPIETESVEVTELEADPNIRWFNARPARPARTIWMTVTGYSPDERSCGDSADGLTATLHSVTTNAMKLVAADPKILPYGSMISLPGYDDESIVPVLDCGGAIKGDRLDLLFPTHDEAMKWGRQRVLVTVWEYADGLPAENPRKLR